MKIDALKNVASTGEVALKTVDLYIHSELISITGDWQWDLKCDSIFCSDVMAALTQHYPGTKGIIHPDDIDHVKEKLAALQESPEELQFRIITTYGEVKKLAATNCYLSQVDELRISRPEKEVIEKAINEKEFEENNENYHLLKEIAGHSEVITKTGTWYINSVTLETYYSDNVFRIHGIPPQSLNSHSHTFSIFIHPDDNTAFTEAFDKAFRERLPLHIEYRIIIADERVKFITLITHWSHNLKGQDILNGLIIDKSESVFAFTKTEEAENKLDFHRKILQLNEKVGNTAFWYMNLLTRQTFYSDNYYRIHGLKPQSVPARPSIFINYVHPDDMEKVAGSINKIRVEHAVPDIEYRIIRADKKLRYIQQKGQMISYGGNELIMSCSVHDVTSQVQNEKKLQELNENASLKDFVQMQSEDMAKISSWMWEPDTNHTIWSDGIYALLGYKKSIKELTQEQLLNAVLPEDRNMFREEMKFVVEGSEHREFNFRILRIGEVRTLKACFRLMGYEGKKFFIGTMQDVTESLQLQEQLHENLQLNQLLTENILDKVFITDLHNNIILWNRKCEDYFRLKREQVTGRNYFDVFPEQKTEKVINRFNTVLKGEAVHELSDRSSAKKYHDLHMIPLKEKNYMTIGILHIMHDVTKELQLNTSLNERLNFIEKLLEETVDRIIVLDKNLTYTYWNKNAEQHYHVNKEYVIGKNVLEVFPSFINDAFYLEFKKVLKGETVHIGSTIDSEHQGKFSETYLVPLFNDKKEVNGILWIVHDLSKDVALRIAEDELDQKEKHLEKVNDELARQNLIYEYAEEIAIMGTWIWNPETNKSHYSDNMFRLFGMEPQEVEPTFETIPKFIHPDDRDLVLNSAKDLIEGKATIVEYRVIRRDGALRNFRNRTQIIDINNEKYVIGTTQDITEVYERDIAQKTSQLLLMKKDEFISIASHELKTPVSNIKASIQILQDLVEDSPAKENITPFLERSARQVDKLAELINDLLDASIIDGGEIKTNRSLFNISEAIKESAEEISNRVKDCEIMIEGGKNVEVLADRSRIQQVVNNFINNAIKYSPGNKTIKIKIEKSDQQAKVTVTDKGIGISEENMQHVFEKYFRVDGSSKNFSGLGLGLYISKEIIKKHSGTIGVKSSEAKGSAFWFTIPVFTPPPQK